MQHKKSRLPEKGLVVKLDLSDEFEMKLKSKFSFLQ